MHSAYAIVFVIGLVVPSSFASDSSELILETALQNDDSCANSDDSQCSVELLQRRALAKDAEAGDAEDVVTDEEGLAQAEDEVEGTTAVCCRWGQHRTCSKHRHCENGHCTTTKHCHTERPCTSYYRQRRTCTKHRHCENGHCQTRTHCHTQQYCSPALLQEGEAGTEEEQDTNDGEDEVIEEDDGSEESAEATDGADEAEEQVSGCHASTSQLRDCGTGCFSQAAGGHRQHCIANCLSSRKHLAKSCASCYGKQSDCTMVHCLTPCMSSASGHACKSCVQSKCGGDCSSALVQEGEAATEEEVDANGQDEEVIEEDGLADAADEAAREFSGGDDASGCSLEEQGSHCVDDRDCDGRFACCQDTVAKRIGVRSCHSCAKTCHPETHKCKCN